MPAFSERLPILSHETQAEVQLKLPNACSCVLSRFRKEGLQSTSSQLIRLLCDTPPDPQLHEAPWTCEA